MKKIRSFIVPGLCMLIVIALFRFVFLIGYVPSESMEPTIPASSIIFGIRIFSQLSVGDIIVFEHHGIRMVKRIAAAPGDTVAINGANTKIPKDCYYVLGDNSLNSYDSRYWNDPFIEKDKIFAIVPYG